MQEYHWVSGSQLNILAELSANTYSLSLDYSTPARKRQSIYERRAYPSQPFHPATPRHSISYLTQSVFPNPPPYEPLDLSPIESPPHILLHNRRLLHLRIRRTFTIIDASALALQSVAVSHWHFLSPYPPLSLWA